MILTRKVHARQEESKLNLALSELKASRELCEQLMRERDDNEREFLDVLNSNKKLKCEMAQLHTQHTEAIEARDRLQFVVDGFSQCSSEYEQTLHDKAHLEQQLHEANNQISHLETINHNITASLNNSLFSELVSARASQSQHIDLNPLTIDLTCESDSCHSSRTLCYSNKKLKKYIKINKFITKTNRLVKRQKFFIKNVKLNKERFRLLNQLNIYSNKLNQRNRKYETDTQNLQLEIDHLTAKLHTMTNKYSASEKQMREYMLAMDELVRSQSQENPCEKCDSSNVLPACTVPTCDTTLPHGASLLLPSQCNNNSSCNNNNVVIFSDEIGKNLGSLLTSKYPGQSIINHCMPGCTFGNILERIINYNFNHDATLIIICANRAIACHRKKITIDIN
ncbi:uncharacterized protein LOC126912302 [Spodoptera frugiperda]|uniref:Uncharacterized protein LOC126912302 n=1 Tax=Spodoptera frugiperda TaxID=7108 RepID=A0A9R0E5V7_SPOFR|nr:uncharacterized protein LOC126912302 [Spodoptera frugiperda]